MHRMTGRQIKQFALLSVVAVSLLGTASAEAAKCKYSQDTVDNITGETVRSTRWKAFRFWANDLGATATIAVTARGDKRTLALIIKAAPVIKTKRPTKQDLDNFLTVAAGANLLLLLPDDSILELHATTAMLGDADFTLSEDTVHYSITSTNITVHYELDTAAVAALTAQGVNDMRASTTSGDIDFTSGRKPSKAIQEALGCLQ